MNKDGIITAPVNIETDIAKVLAASSFDLGTLCSNYYGTINKYSRKKPVCIEGVDVNLTYNTPGHEWWRAYNGQCGLIIPIMKCTSTAEAISKFFDGSMKWGYEAPPPSSKYPARALDFDGYYHYAIPFFSTEGLPKDIWLTAGYGEHILNFSLDVMTEGDDYNLGINDIRIQSSSIEGLPENISEWYPGVCMNKGSYWFVKTTDKPVGESSFDVSISGQQDTLAGVWKLIPILCNKQVDTYNGNDVEAIYICADVDPIDVEIHEVGTLTYGITLAHWASDPDLPKHRYLDYTAFIINRSTSSHTFDVKIFVGYTPDGKHPLNGGVLTNTKILKIGEIFVPAAPTTDWEDRVEITFSSIGEGGEYDRLDIGNVYAPDQENTPNAVYWVAMQIGNEVTPYDSYFQIEQEASEE